MCTVGVSGTKSAMPRLPRVMSTACMPVCVEQLAAGPLEHARIVVDADAERLLDLGFVRRARGQVTIVEHAVTAVDENRNRMALLA